MKTISIPPQGNLGASGAESLKKEGFVSIFLAKTHGSIGTRYPNSYMVLWGLCHQQG